MIDLDLGPWAPYIARCRLGELTIWSGFEPLLDALAKHRPSIDCCFMPLSPARATKMLIREIKRATDSVARLVVGHHTAQHFRRAVFHGDELLNMYETVTGFEIPLIVRQEFLRALAAHDAHHPGSTFRSTATRGPASLVLPKLGLDVSVEWATAVANDQRLAKRKLCPLKRLFNALTVLASTYGHGEPRGKELGLYRFGPVTLLDHGMRVADVATTGDILGGIEEDVTSMFAGVPPKTPPTSQEELFAARYAFLEYALSTMEDFDRVTGVPVTRPMQDAIRRRLEAYQRIEAGEYPVGAMLLGSCLHDLHVGLP